MMLLGIDPGQSTGLAVFRGGKLAALETIRPHEIERTLRALKPARVVYEDSRLQGHIWTRGLSASTSAKMARNVGQIDAWCSLIVDVCAELGIPAHGISPRAKGSKLDAEAFGLVTGWDGKSNQHERDGAMVAWQYRMAGG